MLHNLIVAECIIQNKILHQLRVLKFYQMVIVTFGYNAELLRMKDAYVNTSNVNVRNNYVCICTYVCMPVYDYMNCKNEKIKPIVSLYYVCMF